MRFFGGRRMLVQKPSLPVLREVPNHDPKGRMAPHQAEGDQPQHDEEDEKTVSGFVQHTGLILP
jgi:hypothetical protein